MTAQWAKLKTSMSPEFQWNSGPCVFVTFNTQNAQITRITLAPFKTFACTIHGSALKEEILAWVEAYLTGKEGQKLPLACISHQTCKNPHPLFPDPSKKFSRKGLQTFPSGTYLAPQKTVSTSFHRGGEKCRLDCSQFTPFMQAGIESIRSIPFGEVATYGAVAKNAGNPHASRALGNVCHRNPYPLIIPCHRVIASNGSLGGFAYGLKMKQDLLRFEALVSSSS